MDTPANTWMYFFAGYTVILTSLAVYSFSLVVRWKKLRTRLQKLENASKSKSLDVEKGKAKGQVS
jgi:hypothetical protein